MSFDTERIRESTRRIAKFVRKNSKRPSSNAIHNLRTSARSLETAFATLGLDSRRSVKRSLRDLQKVRKRAGKVRDMDVLTADMLTVKKKEEEDCIVQLVEHVGAERKAFAKKLRLTIDKVSPELLPSLKRSGKRVRKLLKQANTDPAGSDAMSSTMAVAIKLSSELNNPAQLNRSNLHQYRLKVKELRDVLKLSNQANGEEFLRELTEVKDAIGEWHDWEELIAIATQLLDHGRPCQLMKHLQTTSNLKYEHALALASHLRNSYLKNGRAKKTSRHSNETRLSPDVLRATSAIAQQ
jgi:CHAD domain-containing protein